MWTEIDDSAMAHSYLITVSRVDGASRRTNTHAPYLPYVCWVEMPVIYIELNLILKIPTIPFFAFSSFDGNVHDKIHLPHTYIG